MANRPVQTAEDAEHLFAQPSFYAEFAPLEDHSNFVDSIYILKDRGRLTASRVAFASPLREIAFGFRETVPGSGYSGKVVVNEPNFGHRKKSRAFFGWIIGIKFKPNWSGSVAPRGPSDRGLPEFLGAHRRYESIVSRHPSSARPTLARAFTTYAAGINHQQRLFRDVARPRGQPCKSRRWIGANAS